jgi:thioesterase domain-containing protein/acyl carrier protein
VDCSYELTNHYGPTENTVVATWARVEAKAAWDIRPSIGRPISNNQVYVLDRQLEAVPEGTPGELHIGGRSLATGYLNRADLTAERFVPSPFADGERLYKTGDLACWLPDGTVEFLGRIDHQVKLRGVRIELGEIESALLEAADVEQAVVVLNSSAEGDPQLAGYVIASEDVEPTVADLREHLRERLPEIMVPSTFTTLAEFPLTANGKIDRGSLPDPNHADEAPAVEFVAPRNSTEERIAAIWIRVLGTSEIGVLDRFLDVGGNSLSAVRMMAELQEAFGVSVPLRNLFQEGTVENLAQAVETEQLRPVPLPLVQIKAGDDRRPLFCVHPVEGAVVSYMQLAERLDEEQPVYALQSPGLEGEAMPLTSVEEMAAYYIEAIRSVQAEGPYLLSGWSFGGLVAFEMGRQLAEVDQEVEFLALFDSFVVSRYEDEGSALDPRIVANGIHNYLAQMQLESPVSIEELVQHEPLEQIHRVLEELKLLGIDLPEEVASQAENLLTLWEINARAAQRYVPKSYEGRVTLFVAKDNSDINPAAVAEQVAVWREVSGREPNVIHVGGSHQSLLFDDSDVGGLAAHMRGFLD